MSEIDSQPFPRLALYAAGIVIALSITAAAIGRYNNVHHPVDALTQMGPIKSTVDIQFFDEADGTVIVKNAATSSVILRILPGEDAFIRAVMRGFARDRAIRKIGRDTPFRLYRLVDGRIAIEDPTTNKRISLRAFGPTQQAAFSRLIPDTPSK